MRPESDGRSRSDRAIREMAASQHGVVTLAQLTMLGLSRRAVAHRTKGGRLIRLHHGVYAAGPPTEEGRWMAAVLACGDGAVVSHRSAAALWGLLPDVPGRIDVTVGGTTGRSHRAIVSHRCVASGEERTVCRGVPCTTVARTLIDLAAVVDRRSLERAVDRAEELRAFDLSTVNEAIARNRGRRGVARLARVLAEHDGAIVTQSEAEERLLAALERAGLPMPELNAWIPIDSGSSYRADFLWREAGLVVEVDGRTYHAKRRAFRRDRQRDRRLALVGLETRRYEAGEVFEDPAMVTAEIRAFLSPRS